MWTISDLFRNYFTHKDFLPDASLLPGSLFTPLHIFISICCVAIVVLIWFLLRKKDERTLQKVFTVFWITTVVAEIVKDIWEIYSCSNMQFEWAGSMPLYPCSVYMYALPFAIWGKGNVRFAACGYVCTLGLLGGAVNFVYPVTVMSDYSCISFAGFHTLFYHGILVLTAMLMLSSGYHSYKGITKSYQLLLPAIPALIQSIPVHFVNYSPINSDYMFFKMNSFFFAPIGAATPDWVSTLLVYGIYLFIHAIPYIPSWIVNRRRLKAKA